MDNKQPNREPFIPILALLGMIAILILILAISFISRSTTPEVSEIPQPTLPQAPTKTTTKEGSSTPTLSPRPTWTLRPSGTPSPTYTTTPTLTPTRLPTLRIETPYKFNFRYELEEWSTTKANDLIELLKVTIDPLATTFKNPVYPESESGYYALAYAQQEALLRYPNSFLADEWRWGLANSLAHMNDPRAIELYSKLLEDALETGQVRFSELVEWFASNEVELSLEVHNLTATPGELGRHLLEIKGAGGAYIWMQELPDQVNLFPLTADFDFNSTTSSDFVISDFTGDDIDEIAIYFAPGIDNFLLNDPQVFSLSHLPPEKLLFRSEIPYNFMMEYHANIAAIPDESGTNVLQYTAVFFPACPVYVTRSYEWNGTSFDPMPFQYLVEPEPNLEGFCEVVLDHASLSWGPQAALSIAEQLLPIWPPEFDSSRNPYPTDADDAWLYRLGIYNALLGYQLEAEGYFNKIVTNPSVTSSRWIVEAQKFLESFDHISDIYIACRSAQYCHIHQALELLTRLSNVDDPDTALTYLQNHGVDIRTSGSFDFNLDGNNERWMAIKPHPETRLEFWILSPTPKGVRALFVDYIDSDKIYPYFQETSNRSPVVQLEPGKGFILEEVQTSGDQYIKLVDVEYNRPTIIKDGYQAALNKLFSGVDPLTIRNTLLDIKSNERFAGDCDNFWICDQFFYTLGLTYELTGDDLTAVDIYIDLWWNFVRNSLFTIMAREKLHFIPPPPTATSTPTITRTPTNTPDPNATVTPTRTATTNPYPYPYPTP